MILILHLQFANQPGFSYAMFRVAITNDVPQEARQMAAIFLKNQLGQFINELKESDEGIYDSNTFTNEEQIFIKQNLISGMINSPAGIR